MADNPLTVGATYYAVGLDMKCRKVVTPVVLVSVSPADAHGRDCVLSCRAVRSVGRTADLYRTPAEVRAAIARGE